MASAQKVISALHANWSLSAAGLLLSFAASVVLVRTIPSALFAEYAAVLAMIGVATFIFEAGANSGLTRYLSEAVQQRAGATFYHRLLRRRALAALLCGVTFVALGPLYASVTSFENLAGEPWLFVLMAAVVAATLTRLLAHYGLLALFEARTALLLQQLFLVLRALALALTAVVGGGLWQLITALLVVSVLEGVLVHQRLARLLAAQDAPLPPSFISRAQHFGLLTICDKACAMLGSGTVLLLVFAPQHPATTLAFLALAVDLVGKLVSLTVMPMGNLVAPFLSQTSDDSAAQSLAVARVVKLSSLLYCFTVGAGMLLLPWFVPAVYGSGYAGAAGLALLLLVPTAFENWVRGCCSPALLRNGRFRELMLANAAQATLTLATLACVYGQPLEFALLALGCARCLGALLNLVLVRRLVARETFLVPLQGAAIALVSWGISRAFDSAFAESNLLLAFSEALIFTALFFAGLRWLVFRDPDTLHLAYRVSGERQKVFTRLLPAPALPHA